ncbi:hypothetical protein [Saccharopolyspora aridisoli]|nr:hypothetical protein [Saccharopolyspora aridisoli]
MPSRTSSPGASAAVWSARLTGEELVGFGIGIIIGTGVFTLRGWRWAW